MPEKNLIQVYGLPRSGTNFVEWTLQKYFSQINYQNIFLNETDIPKLKKYQNKIALKHSYPNLNHSEYAIIICELPTHARGDGLGFGSHHSY
jgi:hypothetical protein